MKVIITSGGTSEAIDSVRAITNHSTGNLGKTLAEYCLEKGDQVTLVTTSRAVKPESHPNLEMKLIESVADLESCLEEIVPEHHAIIHAMAVSDYRPVYMTDLAELSKTDNIGDLLTKRNQENKISSQAETQVLFLQKTPKIISKIKSWNPSIVLVGFKLLVDVSPDRLIGIARESLVKNQANMIVANDLLEVTPAGHRAWLVRENSQESVDGRIEIAHKLYEEIHKEKL